MSTSSKKSSKTQWAEHVVANEDYLPWKDVHDAKSFLGLLESADEVRARLIREAHERAARRIGLSSSIASADAAQYDLNRALEKIHALSENELSLRAQEREPGAQERDPGTQELGTQEPGKQARKPSPSRP